MRVGKVLIFFLIFLFSTAGILNGQVTKTIGGSGSPDYATIKAAFDAVNAGAIQGVITLQVITNTSETASAVLNASGTGSASYSSIIIYPTVTGLTLSGNINGPFIDLNGADNVTIDGRVGATGSAKDLIITNTSTGSSACTFRYINSAENNTVKYCTSKGSATSNGIFLFSSSTAGNGNDGNTIDNNNITADVAGRAVNAIYSTGSTGFDNSGNTISNNSLYDFLKQGAASYGINLTSFSNAWSITGNSFYETTPFTPASNVEYNAIRIFNTSGGSFVVSDNFIGGSASLCTGTWTKTNAADNKFYAIYFSSLSSSASSIQNNTIKNYAWSNSGNAEWAGIYISAGTVNIGTMTGNRIGANTGTGSISVTGGATGLNLYGIYASGSGTIDCQNNNIGSIVVANINATFASNFYGINKTGTGTTTIINNTIGSTSTASSIQASSASTANTQSVFGINNTNSGTLIISNNTIANLTNGTTNTTGTTSGLINGITSLNGTNTISNNSIHDLTIANANISADNLASVCGIALQGNSLRTVTGNTIYNLSNTFSSFTGSVIGLYYESGTGINTVSNNFIHSLSVTGSSSVNGSLFGIKINTGAATYSNNIISLSGNTATSIYGIYDTGAPSQTCNLYFNTVYIGGSLTPGITNKSYALYSAGSANTRNIRNNIFYNARSTTSGSGLHYAAFFNYAVSTLLTLDFNDYFATGTGGNLGSFNSSDITSLPLITGFDQNSISVNPVFASAGGTTPASYIPSSNILAGTTITTLSTDYALSNRAGTPTIGAFEVTLNLNIDVYKSGEFQSGYFRLKDVFDKINNGTHTGALDVRIKANTSETASAVLYQSGYTGAGGVSNYSSVNIYPVTAGVNITGNLNGAIIDFNGADNITIDGRAGETGNSKDLTITNTNTGTSATTIRFYNSAEKNTVKYCTIEGSETMGSNGVIMFSTSSAGNGNNANTIDNNNITGSISGRPVNIIYSYGTTGRENSGNIISNNNIYDFLNPGVSSNGILIGGFSNNWNVTGNSFYETTTLVPTGAYTYEPIRVSSSTDHIVKGNYIGGSAPLCAGQAFTVNANKAHYFCGIYVSGGVTAPCIIENNIIQNINYTSIQSNPWDGIFINAGNVDVTGNTIGAPTGNSSIIITTPLPAATATITGGVVNNTVSIVGGGSGYITAPLVTFSINNGGTGATATAIISGGVVTGITVTNGGSGYTSVPSVVFDGQTNGYSTSHGMINNSIGTVNITNNNIGSITTVGSDAYSHGFESVYLRGATGTTNVTNNLIGSLSTANSINVSSNASSSLQKQDVYGLYAASGGNAVLTGNTIANLTNSYSGVIGSSRTRPIQVSGGSNIVKNNTIRNITSSSGQTGTMATASIIGISLSVATAGTTQTITGNSISLLKNINPTAQSVIYGIYYGGPVSDLNTVSGNFIHSISFSSTNMACDMDGILFNNGLTTCFNNIINLGVGITNGYKINGIWDESSAVNNNNIYFNSIYIGGTVSSGATSSTAALWNKNNASTRNYRNNILVNARSGGTAGKHYAIRLEGVAGATIDYNDYYSASGSLGRIGLLDKADLATWKLGTGQDANSLSLNPGFTIAGGTSALNYYTSAVLPAISVTGIITDYTGSARGAIPKMGALEINNYTWQGGTSTDFATAANWSGGVVPPDGSDIAFASGPERNCVLDQNRSVKNITNTQGTYFLVANGKQLTITGDLDFTNGAKIDATSASSMVVFEGSAAQNIPSGAFVSNSVDALTLNNSNGLTLNGDMTVSQSLTLTSGSLSIGTNTLTLNGAVTTTTGTMTGGSSSNIIFGGNGSATTLPPVSLNNLTINRAGGISLGGTVGVSGTLALTAGTLTLGSNTLIISGSSLNSVSGNIDAGNSGSTLTFTNTSPLTLPPSFFSGAVNNLTINSTGGITSVSDFTVNGVLSLQSANPSSIKGSLDLRDGSSIKTLTMGPSATTIGMGDVTGIIRRTTFVAQTSYSFGNQFTTVAFIPGGTYPASLQMKLTIGVAPTWNTLAIKRVYELVNTGGSNCFANISMHYLDAELNGNMEERLVKYRWQSPSGITEMGRSNYDMTDNWIENDQVGIGLLPTDFGQVQISMAETALTSYTWNGSLNSVWENTSNWTPVGSPSNLSNVIIPDGATTLNDPTLTTGGVSLKSISIENGGILNSGDQSLTLTGTSGAWINNGTFNAGSGIVTFTGNGGTISGATDFYNLTINSGADVTNQIGSIIRIGGTMTNNGVWRAGLLDNTVEYNGGSQTVLNANGTIPGYHNLILSGSGTKAMPATSLSVYGDLTISGTVVANAGSAINIGGELAIESGSTFIAGNYNHTIKGNFDNSGTFTASAATTITMNGTSAQEVYGSAITAFENLIVNNSSGVEILVNTNVNNSLNLINGNLTVKEATLGVNGSISKSTGFLDVSKVSSLIFGGTAAITIPGDLYTDPPSINNLTINRSGGVTLGNQSMILNGVLSLISGTLTLGANTLTIAGSSPVRTSGSIDASNTSASVEFTNTSGITLPESVFSAAVNNLTINSAGGVTSAGDLTVNGVLNLQSVNSADNKGILDMLDGSTIKTLDMGASSSTIGAGDVTGIIRRRSIVPGVTYTFGNQFMTAYFTHDGTPSSEMSVRISIGTSPSWITGAIAREIEIIQTGGSATKAIFSYHYLDGELNGNTEDRLILWVKSTPVNFEYGRSAYNSADNWVSLSNVNVAFFSPTWDGTKNITLAEFGPNTSLTWNGSLSDSWTSVENWTPNTEGPSPNKNIFIPDASTTLHSPTLPAFTEIKSLTIDAAGILNSAPGAQLTINGGSSAFVNAGGTFNPGTSNVIFSGTDATISGTTNFYNVTTTTAKVLWMTSESIMRIAGAMTNNGAWQTITEGPTTVEYNGGNQTVVVPDPVANRYSTLILSGSGEKALPNSDLSIEGNLSLTGTASATTGAEMTVGGDLSIIPGAALTIAAGKELKVTGTITNTTDQGLVIKSDATDGDGILINNTPGVNATVELFLTGGSSNFHFFVPPVSNMVIGTSLQNVKDNLGIINFNNDLLSYSESAAGSNQNNGWQYYDGYTGTTGYTYGPFSSLVSSKGYNIYLTADDKISFKGTLNSSPHNFSLPRTSASLGWNLVGNPYPCNYDLKGVVSLMTPDNGLDKTIYFYHSGSYSYYNMTILSGTGGVTNIVPPMQGFFVRVNPSTYPMSFPEGSKSSIVAAPRSKKANLIEVDPIKKIKLALSNSSVSDETIVCLIDNATTGFDGDYDAYKLFGANPSVPDIYTNLGSIKYAINSFPGPGSGEERIPVVVGIKTPGTYKIDVTEFENFDGIRVVLRHGAIETTLGRNSGYSFSAAAGTFTDFELIIGGTATEVEKITSENLKTWYSNNFLYINYPSEIPAGTGSVIIYDIQGKMVYNNNEVYSVPGQTIQLPLNFPKGIYLTRITVKDHTYVSKIVVI